MRITRSQQPSWAPILYTTLLLSLCAPLSYAQLTDLPNLATATRTSSSASSAAPTTTDEPSTTTTAAAKTTSTATTPSTSTTAAPSTTTAPSQTSNSPSNTISHLTDLPTIAGAGIPQLVIPYTASAPYMQKSKLPEGTVFIAVGCILGILGVSILAWRGLVAWSLHRSVQRAALSHYPEKQGLMGHGHGRSRSPGFYGAGGGGGGGTKAAQGSAMSLDALHPSAKPFGRPASYVPGSGTAASRASVQGPTAAGLFFSPTASLNSNPHGSLRAEPSASNAALHHRGGDRHSSYLPAGFYAAPSASLAQSAASTPPQRPQRNVSPPDSPGLFGHGETSTLGGGSSVVGVVGGAAGMGRDSPVSLATGYGRPSMSSLRLDGPGGRDGREGGRAPSAYLEDLFRHHGRMG